MKNWVWKHRQLLSIPALVLLTLALIRFNCFPRIDGGILLITVMAAAIMLNFFIWLIFRADLLDWGYDKKKMAAQKPDPPLSPMAQKIWDAMQRTIAAGNYDWRTAESLSRETGIEAAAVQGILRYDLGRRGFIVCADRDNGSFFTTREHYKKIRTWKDSFWSGVTGKI